MGRELETLTQKELKQILDYDSKTGIFKWKVSKRKTRDGDVAGSVNSYSRRVIAIDRVAFTASRLAFLWMKGSFPKHNIKHLDGNNLNESWDNLEEVVPMNKNKKYPGVYWRVRKSQYEVKFYANGRHVVLGCFDDFNEAVKCKKEADANRKKEMNGLMDESMSSLDVELNVKYKKWGATAMIGGVKVFLGLFITKENAVEAQINAQQLGSLDERGIVKMERNDTFRSTATVNGVRKHCGFFDNKIDAIRARDKMEGTDGY
jgi:hypothetical protein